MKKLKKLDLLELTKDELKSITGGYDDYGGGANMTESVTRMHEMCYIYDGTLGKKTDWSFDTEWTRDAITYYA